MTPLVAREGHVFVDVEATGLLKALAHDRTFSAPIPDIRVQVDFAQDTVDVPVQFSFPGEALLPDAEGISKRDYRQMVDNLRGRDVLNLKKHPVIAFDGRYQGTWKTGTLAGNLTLRGRSCPVSLATVLEREGENLRVSGEWVGTLGALGIKPFTALMGTIKLKDYARLGFEVVFREG